MNMEEVKNECCSPNNLSATDVTNKPHIPAKAAGIIARLTNNMAAADIHSLTFQRHKISNGSPGYVYTAKNAGPSFERVVRLGREESSQDEGCDYAIAVINRRTGKVDCLPTKLICFENVAASEFEAILDNSYKPKVDYSVDNTITRESWADKRRALTDEFGSAKKMKAQDAARQRQVKDETLSVMMNSAFSSTNLKKEEESEQKVTDISMLAKAESSVLPKANMEAKLARDVYSFSNFLSDAEIITFKSEAFDHLNGSRKELIEKGLSPLVCNLIGDISANTERACYIVLLDAMIHCYKMLPRRHCIMEKTWTELQYPVTILCKIRELFFPGEFVKEGGRNKQRKLAINSMDKDRLLAHILCLAIILDYETTSLPITPWAKELAIMEGKITKMAVALGCSVSAATASEGIRLGTTRIARLTGPPQTAKKQFSGRAVRKRR